MNRYSSSSFNGYQVFLLDSHLYAWYFGNNGNIYNNGTLDAGVVTDGLWHHFAFVVDAAGGRIYLDGVLKQSVNWSGTPSAPSTTTPLHFGLYPGTFSGLDFYAGLLDEVSIWNRGLTPDEIQLCMNAGLTGSETSLLGYWKMNEAAGSLINDLGPQGIGAHLFNGVSWTPSGAGVTNAAGSALNFNGSSQYTTGDHRDPPPMMFFRVRYP